MDREKDCAYLSDDGHWRRLSAKCRDGDRHARFRLSPGAGTFAQSMAAGPDNNLWFTGGPGIGKVTSEGNVTEYPVPGSVGSIVSGPDGNLWFTEANAIGRSTTNGEITSFPLPKSKSQPTDITAGPDGDLWFTEEAANQVGRITPNGQITEFPLPPGHHPSAIAAGPDGNLWFTEGGASRIGRITTAGQVTQLPVPGPPAKISDITAGPDGNLWFAEDAGPGIGRITLQGQVTQFAVPTEQGVHSIVSGPGGQLWFAVGYEVGAISTSGAVSWPACLIKGCWAPARGAGGRAGWEPLGRGQALNAAAIAAGRARSRCTFGRAGSADTCSPQ